MMTKFRKKPIVIEAFEMTRTFWDDENHEHPEWAQDARDMGNLYLLCGIGDGCFIRTLEGDHKALWGDMIIRGIKGELYPCKPDIFEAIYEATP
jgi:hypothetical protein